MRENCDELIQLSYVMERGLKATLDGISEELLNYSPAENKMSIGQLAVHCMAWAKYFLSDPKPWYPVRLTCKPMNYPLTLDVVSEVVDEGFATIRDKMAAIDDDLLEEENGEKGPGYITYRLLIHTMVHSNQMAYIRQIKEPEWSFGSHFGDMATAIINMRYHTDRDLSIGGF